MAIKNNKTSLRAQRGNLLRIFSCSVFALFSLISSAAADEISMNTAQMQAMDKITGRVSIIDVPVNGEVKFGSFSIVARECKTRGADETPENFAFIDVVDTNLNGEENNIFKGWMISSSPALHAVEHPIYDVWLIECINKEGGQILSEEELKIRDELPMVRNEEKTQEVFMSVEKEELLISIPATEEAISIDEGGMDD